MATNNKRLSVTELDFDDIKTNLKTYLKAQTEFKDYDFEGSGMSILLDSLAYNTHYLGFNANMAANEMFLEHLKLQLIYLLILLKQLQLCQQEHHLHLQ